MIGHTLPRTTGRAPHWSFDKNLNLFVNVYKYCPKPQGRPPTIGTIPYPEKKRLRLFHDSIIFSQRLRTFDASKLDSACFFMTQSSPPNASGLLTLLSLHLFAHAFCRVPFAALGSYAYANDISIDPGTNLQVLCSGRQNKSHGPQNMFGEHFL